MTSMVLVGASQWEAAHVSGGRARFKRRRFPSGSLASMADAGLDYPAGSADESEVPSQVPRWVRVGAGAIVLAGVVGALLAFRYVDVCDDEVRDSGVVVEVCRHLELTDPPVVAVGVLVLAALGAFFSEISGLGFTLKREVRRATTTAEKALRRADRASGLADKAEQTADLAEGFSRQAHTAPAAVHEDVDQVIDALAQQYNDARRDLRSGTERTREMTAIVSKMISALTEVPPSDFGVSDHLGSSDRGQRLAAYAYIYANPDPRRSQELVDALLDEDKPFGQYWALRALSRLVEISPGSLDRNSVRELERLQQRLGYGTDRWHQVRELLNRWHATGDQ
jgi:hypothetical protein